MAFFPVLTKLIKPASVLVNTIGTVLERRAERKQVEHANSIRLEKARTTAALEAYKHGVSGEDAIMLYSYDYRAKTHTDEFILGSLFIPYWMLLFPQTRPHGIEALEAMGLYPVWAVLGIILILMAEYGLYRYIATMLEWLVGIRSSRASEVVTIVENTSEGSTAK